MPCVQVGTVLGGSNQVKFQLSKSSQPSWGSETFIQTFIQTLYIQ